MEENCGGGPGLHWAVEPRRESRAFIEIINPK
jgi:hypothetical protein